MATGGHATMGRGTGEEGKNNTLQQIDKKTASAMSKIFMHRRVGQKRSPNSAGSSVKHGGKSEVIRVVVTCSVNRGGPSILSISWKYV